MLLTIIFAHFNALVYRFKATKPDAISTTSVKFMKLDASTSQSQLSQPPLVALCCQLLSLFHILPVNRPLNLLVQPHRWPRCSPPLLSLPPISLTLIPLSLKVRLCLLVLTNPLFLINHFSLLSPTNPLKNPLTQLISVINSPKFTNPFSNFTWPLLSTPTF